MGAKNGRWKSGAKGAKFPRMRSMIKLSLVSAVLLSAFACSEKKDDASANGNGFTAIYNASFSVSCKNCHYAGAPAANSNLDMSNATVAYDGLLARVTSPGSLSTCTNQFRVSPGQPSKSYLLGMISGTYTTTNFNGEAGCGHPPTHKDGVNLTAAEVTSIVQWIQSGAAK